MKFIKKSGLILALLLATAILFILIMSSNIEDGLKLKYIYTLYASFYIIFSILLYITK